MPYSLLDSMTLVIRRSAETEESDAQEWEGMRERWDSRRFERHDITLQAATDTVNASDRGQVHNVLIP